MSSTSTLFSLVGWSFLPNLVTNGLQSVYYSITIRAGSPRPQPSSARFVLHRRRIHTLVIVTYLLYTVYEALYIMRRSPSFYSLLGVPLSASEREIKTRFRRLGAMHHPDKSPLPSSVDYFVQLKSAQDTLLNPTKRFAYERFGPAILSWQHCISIRDYLAHGVQSTLPYYGATALVMYVFGLLGYLKHGRYWRWLTMICLCVFELHTMSRPSHPRILSSFINPLVTTFTSHSPILPFQLVELAKKLSVTMFIAFSQLGPVLNASKETGSSEQALHAQLERLEGSTKAVDAEAARLLATEAIPFIGDAAALEGVRGKIKEWLVQNTLRNDPEVRDALGNSLRKRRTNAPAGAKGTR